MKIKSIHPWNVDFNQARKIQLQLQSHISLCPLKKPVELIAGADVSYSKQDDRCFAAIVVLKFPELTVVETATAIGNVTFPYVPGLLTFREGPILLEAFRKVKHSPDVVMFDGQGIAHPQKLGIAAHIGLFLDIPTIGCAKSRLIGQHEPIPPNHGASVLLIFNNQVIGKVIRTRTNIKPVYVSAGHQITLDESVKIVLTSCSKYRLPEPTRQAHLVVNQIRCKF